MTDQVGIVVTLIVSKLSGVPVQISARTWAIFIEAFYDFPQPFQANVWVVP
jgi:hypothetical protein